jgi:hypothetical protein
VPLRIMRPAAEPSALVDPRLGRILAILVLPANIQDRDGGARNGMSGVGTVLSLALVRRFVTSEGIAHGDSI